jgi:hypothetical protein
VTSSEDPKSSSNGAPQDLSSSDLEVGSDQTVPALSSSPPSPPNTSPETEDGTKTASANEASSSELEEQRHGATANEDREGEKMDKHSESQSKPVSDSSSVTRQHISRPNSEINCRTCGVTFSTKAVKALHTCNSILDKLTLVEGETRKTRPNVRYDENNGDGKLKNSKNIPNNVL